MEEKVFAPEELQKSENSERESNSLVEGAEEKSENELPRRNPVPDGSSEAIEDDNDSIEPPSQSHGRSKASMEAEAIKDGKQGALNLDDVSGSLPWEIYRYIKKEDREHENSDFEEYDGQGLGEGMEIYA